MKSLKGILVVALSILVGMSASLSGYGATVTKVRSMVYDPVVSNEPPTRIYVSKMGKELTLYDNNQVVGK